GADRPRLGRFAAPPGKIARPSRGRSDDARGRDSARGDAGRARPGDLGRTAYQAAAGGGRLGRAGGYRGQDGAPARTARRAGGAMTQSSVSTRGGTNWARCFG